MTPCDNCKLKLRINYDPDKANVDCPYFEGCGMVQEHNKKIMENLYEERYKRAIKIAKEWKSGLAGNGRIEDCIDELFPELIESEDERSRREITDFICCETDRGCITQDQIKKSDSWLAWLERQRNDGLYLLGKTEIYLEDDGDDPPYTQEWLDIGTHEFQLPEGVFKPGDKVEILIRKK